MTWGCELKVLDAKNKSGMWMTRMTLGRELKALNAMNNSTSWMI